MLTSDMYACMYKQATIQDQSGLGACIPRKVLEIRCSEIAILGQKQSCSSYMAPGELFGCPCMHFLSQLTLNSHTKVGT